jgi:hypothetical protein
MQKPILTVFAAAVAVALVGLLVASEQPAASNYTLYGFSWPGSGVSYAINPNFPGTAGSTAQQVAALNTAAQNWVAQSCVPFSWNYTGQTGVSSTGDDGTNAVFFSALDGGGALATTTLAAFGASFVWFDMRFWASTGPFTFQWTTGFPSAFEFDIQGIATHEFGHVLGLDHETTDAAATMWPSASQGTASADLRSLQPNDIAGAQAVYGGNCGLPVPNPMTFAAPPAPTSTSSITMTATTATIPTLQGVEYEFALVPGTATGGTSSGWQAQTTYVDSGLQPNASYVYNVKARNASIPALATAASANASIYTHAATPGVVLYSNVQSSRFDLDGVTANGNPALTKYAIRVNGQYLTATGALQATETWFSSAVWNIVQAKGLTPGATYTVDVKGRNENLVQTAFGPPVFITMLNFPTTCGGGSIPNGAGGFASTLTVNGQDGAATNRRVHVPLGSSFTIAVAQPPANATPANFILWGWFGVPDPSFYYTIPGVGQMCFTPCEANPGLGLGFTIASSYGPTGCGALVLAPAAPFALFVPSLPFPLLDLTMQAVEESSPGVLRPTNALVFDYD